MSEFKSTGGLLFKKVGAWLDAEANIEFSEQN